MATKHIRNSSHDSAGESTGIGWLGRRAPVIILGLVGLVARREEIGGQCADQLAGRAAPAVPASVAAAGVGKTSHQLIRQAAERTRAVAAAMRPAAVWFVELVHQGVRGKALRKRRGISTCYHGPARTRAAAWDG